MNNDFTEVIILGSGTCVPSLRRAGPAQCLRTNGLTILVDSASGTLRQLLRAGIKQDMVDLILYTHFHPDHTGELVPFIFASKYGPGFKRAKPIFVWGAEGLKDLLRGFESAYGEWVRPLDDTILFEEIPVHIRTSQQFPPVTISTIHTNHTPQSLAYRIEPPSGKAVVFSGDTDFCPEIIEISQGADLLVLECAAPEHKKVQGHMTPSEAGVVAREAGVKRLILTHFYPECDRSDMITPCKKNYTGPVILAEDLMRIVI